MKAEIRVNPKTKKTEYRARYLWKDANGKRKDSQTGWFPTELQAFKNAQQLKEHKERLAKDGNELKRNKSLLGVFDEWIAILKEQAERETTENTTTDVCLYQRARTIRKFYFPAVIQKTPVREVDTLTFRKWIEYINTVKIPASRKRKEPKEDDKSKKPEMKELSGNTVREYRMTLVRFNTYLGGQGYYLDNEMETKILNLLRTVKLKSRQVGRKKRYCPTVAEVSRLFNYYEGNMIEDFRQFYWYTLFMVLFYSGMRPEEVIGLRWKHVHFDAERPYIDVCNAISERELKSNVERRLADDIYHLKNNNSEREIPMLNYYYDTFESYRYRFKEYFAPANMGECFVFPNIDAKGKSKKEKLQDYQKQKNILRELDRVCSDEDVMIPKTDVQMLRHACATWLITDLEHGGMGYEESRARDYFGHTSDDMLRNVYAKLDKRQRANRTSETFSGITKKHKEAKVPKNIKESKELNELIKDPEKNKTNKYDAIYNRLQAEISDAIEKGKKEYQFLLKDFAVIYAIINDNLDEGRDLTKEINIVPKKTSMDSSWIAEFKLNPVNRLVEDEVEAQLNSYEEETTGE